MYLHSFRYSSKYVNFMRKIWANFCRTSIKTLNNKICICDIFYVIQNLFRESMLRTFSSSYAVFSDILSLSNAINLEVMSFFWTFFCLLKRLSVVFYTKIHFLYFLFSELSDMSCFFDDNDEHFIPAVIQAF